MKPFSIWLAITLFAFGMFGGSYHFYLTENPRRVLVVVDSSFHMKSVWQQVSGELKNLSSLRYAEFSLITGKNSVHGWSPRLNLGKVSPYAPRSFSKLKGKGNYPAIEEAGEIFFLTNADASMTEGFRGWHIIRLE
jgi:hypothetical protein